jgi:hypothetical protein
MDETPHEQSGARAGLVKVGRYLTPDEANIYAAMLDAEGIPCHIFGYNDHLATSSLAAVELFVARADAERAMQVLSRPELDDLEPAEDDDSPQVDQQGRPLAEVAAYESVRDLRDAETILASAEVVAYPPKLVPRGNRPHGQGNRFVLRVAEDDLELARQLLIEEAEEDQNEPRCPKCGAWRVRPISSFFKEIASAFGPPQRPREMECEACRYRGNGDEFWPAQE